MNKRLLKSLAVIFLVLLIDQGVKIWIKTNMMIGDEFIVFHDWFIIHFIENNGMAFGLEIAGNYGKLFLSIFRIAAITAIGWYLVSITKKKNIPFGFLVCISLIFAGAVGNMIDSAFYGLIFNHSYGQVATLFPEEGGYAPLLYGHVVDMLYFPIFQGRYPDWLPLKGGDPFIFFRPVFNIADASISIGIFSIFIFYSSMFSKKTSSEEDHEDEGGAIIVETTEKED